MNQHRSIFPHLETSTDRNPGGFEAGPTENPEDENVEMDPEENLPWPDQDLIKKWWIARQGNFAKGRRLLADLHRRFDAKHGVRGSWLQFPVFSVRSWRNPGDSSSGGLVPAAFPRR